MFRALWNRILAIYGTRRLESRVSFLESKLDTRKEEADAKLKELTSHRQVFEEIQQQFQVEMDKATRLLNNARLEIQKLEEALEATREELRTAREITIPGLVAANQVFIERWHAEVAVQATRSALMTTSKDTE